MLWRVAAATIAKQDNWGVGSGQKGSNVKGVVPAESPYQSWGSEGSNEPLLGDIQKERHQTDQPLSSSKGLGPVEEAMKAASARGEQWEKWSER